MRASVTLAVGLAGCFSAAGDAMDAVPASCAPVDGCSVVTCGGTCYLVCLSELTHDVAEDRCLGWGGCLLSIDPGELSCLTWGERVWTAATQDGVAALEVGWSWTCGGTVVAAGEIPWTVSEPNDEDGAESGDEQCAFFDGASDTVVDARCGVARAFVCERATAAEAR